MRRRIYLALLAVALLAVGGFAVPLLGATAERRTQELVLQRGQDLDRLSLLALAAGVGGSDADGGAAAAAPTSALRAAAERYTDLYGESLLVLDASGTTVVGTGRWSGARGRGDLDATTGAVVGRAVLGLPVAEVPEVRPWSRASVALTRSLGPTTGVLGVLVLDASVTAAARDVAATWLTVLTGAGLSVVVVAVAARAVSGWLLRPLLALDAAVHEVTSGHEGAQVDHPTGPGEVRRLASSFNTMSAAVATSAAEQRRLVADAAHQLRNPLAALRLRVDVLALRLPDHLQRESEQVGDELARLEGLLGGLDALASADAAAGAADGPRSGPVDVVAVVRERTLAWRAAARARGIRLDGLEVPETPEVPDAGPTVVLLPAGHLEQVLDVVIDNAVRHAGPGSRLGWSLDGDGGDAVWLRARDDGPGLDAQHRGRATSRFWRGPGQGAGSGLGLSIATTLLEAHGGRLLLEPARPRGLVVALRLPAGAPAQPSP